MGFCIYMLYKVTKKTEACGLYNFTGDPEGKTCGQCGLYRRKKPKNQKELNDELRKFPLGLYPKGFKL